MTSGTSRDTVDSDAPTDSGFVPTGPAPVYLEGWGCNNGVPSDPTQVYYVFSVGTGAEVEVGDNAEMVLDCSPCASPAVERHPLLVDDERTDYALMTAALGVSEYSQGESTAIGCILQLTTESWFIGVRSTMDDTPMCWLITFAPAVCTSSTWPYTCHTSTWGDADVGCAEWPY